MAHRSDRDCDGTPFDSSALANAEPDAQPAWRRVRLKPYRLASGQRVSVHESLTVLNPFATLTAFRLPRDSAVPRLLIVMPMSGHFSILFYDLIGALLRDHDVFVLDWTNAKHILAVHGSFGFEQSIATVCSAMRGLGPDTHLIGVCQSVVPAIAAATALVASGDPGRPSTLTLLGGPVDPTANPTRVSFALGATPLFWFEHNMLESVGKGYAGHGRSVYPAKTQLRGLLIYLSRHLMSRGALAAKWTCDDGADPAGHPFFSLYAAVKDIPANAFLESLAAIYHRRALWTGQLSLMGCKLHPEYVDNLPLLTVEARDDDIAGVGQTAAAHRLFHRIPGAWRDHFEIESGGHFALFHGAACREQIAPKIASFVARFDVGAAAAVASGCRRTPARDRLYGASRSARFGPPADDKHRERDDQQREPVDQI